MSKLMFLYVFYQGISVLVFSISKSSNFTNTNEKANFYDQFECSWIT